MDISSARLTSEMDPILNVEEVSSKLVDLVQMGLIHKAGDAVKLSERGRAIYKQLAERQNRIRQQAMQGISSAEYDCVIEVLAKIAANLKTPSYWK
jgi:DNA-binding MarR family transcriptional regulator